MKNLIIILVTSIISFLYFSRDLKKKDESSSSGNGHVVVQPKPSIRIVVAQDVSLSTRVNGVQLIKSDVFWPYFNTYDRNIELNFSVISDHSTMEMLTLSLYARSYTKPQIPSIIDIPIKKKRELKVAYLDSMMIFIADSTLYFSERAMKIKEFSFNVDSLTNYYKHSLTGSTDLTTTLCNADKVFNSSLQDQYKNYLLLLSDGQNTSSSPLCRLKNPITTILINAGGNIKTSIDSIINIQFQSPTQAINHTLK